MQLPQIRFIPQRRIPASRRPSLIAKRDRRDAERELRRAKAQLTDFVMLWAEGVLDDRPHFEFLRARDRLVRRYRVALANVMRASGLEAAD